MLIFYLFYRLRNFNHTWKYLLRNAPKISLFSISAALNYISMVCTIVLARFSLTFISTFLSKSLFYRTACNCLAFKDTFKRSFFVNFGNTTKVLVTALLHIFFVLLALIPPNHTKLSISQLLYQINIKCCVF